MMLYNTYANKCTNQKKKHANDESSDEDSISSLEIPEPEDNIPNDAEGITNDADGACDGDNDPTYTESVDDSQVVESDAEDPDIPDDYIFRSYFAFVAWGPFAPICDRLEILMTTDDKKNQNHRCIY